MTNLIAVRRPTESVLLLLTLSATCYAQSPPIISDPEIVTDRPDVTESSIVVPKASLQVENGATWTTDHAFQTFDLSESLIRLGVATRTEIRLVVPNYLGGITRTDATGFGDCSGDETAAWAAVGRRRTFGDHCGQSPYRAEPGFEPWL